MVEKAALGTIVAIIVILLFLRRTTAISVVSIPLSILIAMVALKLSNVSLNILTLGALTVAIGRVIDDSIVVVENIYRRLSDSNETMKGENLIINATTEVFKPIMSSLVTIVVFYHLSLYQVPSVKCLDHLRWQSHLVFSVSLFHYSCAGFRFYTFQKRCENEASA